MELRALFTWGARPRHPSSGYRLAPADVAVLRADTEGHVLAVLDGTLAFDDHWNLPPVSRGRTILLPAAIGRQRLTVLPGPAAKLLHIALP
jgi:hypothetical protein